MSNSCHTAIQRLKTEFRGKDLEEKDVFHIDIPDFTNSFPLKLTGYVKGPRGTPFAGGSFHMDIAIPAQYPICPPKFKFTHIPFHPNISYNDGSICLDILDTSWSPAWKLENICRALSVLLELPNADSPLNCDAGNMIRAGDVEAYTTMAALFTEEIKVVRNV